MLHVTHALCHSDTLKNREYIVARLQSAISNGL
jgi:hypothetical protein